jgi:hypothetical protein
MKARNTWVLPVVGCSALGIVALIISIDVYDFPRYSIIRAAALLGYVSVFSTSMSSLYMRQLTQFFGRPFIKTHHIIAVTGLVLLYTHAFFNALSAETLAVVIPKFTSLNAFLVHGGRAALWFITIAAVAALLRTRLGTLWRMVHWLNYLAFFIATFHAFSLGTDFRYLPVRIVALIMVCVLAFSFLVKRMQQRHRLKKTQRKNLRQTAATTSN